MVFVAKERRREVHRRIRCSTHLKRLGLDLPPQAEAIDLPRLVTLQAGDGLEPDAAERIAKVVLPLLEAKQRNPRFFG